MPDKVFIDTNLWVYAYSATEPEKRTHAQAVITSYEAYVSTQVLKELSNVLQKKYKLPWESIRKVLLEVEATCTIFYNTEETVLRATYIAERYGFSFYDSLIIASALATESTILFSEDLHHGQQIEEKLLIRNPFI